MSYQYGNTFTNGEQPSASKWDQVWRNTDALYDMPRTIQHVRSEDGAVNTGTTTVPLDDTIPQFTEGNNLMSCAITPLSATSKLLIMCNLMCSYSVAATIIASLSVDGTGDALKTVAVNQATATGLVNISIIHMMTSGTTSALTYRVKVGGSTAGTITINGQSGARKFGGVAKSSIDIIEYSS